MKTQETLIKTCTKCGEEKPLKDFRFRKARDNHNSYCRACESIIAAAYRFNTTVEHLQDLLEDARCEVCGTEPDTHNVTYKHTGGLVIDHCHDSGDIRGVLCRTCNLALGHAQDSTEILEGLIQYLQQHS